MNSESSNDSPWYESGWLEEAHAWIHAALETSSLRLIGTVEPFHNRPWSTVWRVPTTEGSLYFKASAPVLAHEAGLTHLLARLRPEILPDLVAVDTRRGWLLMRDCGRPLRTFIRAEKSLERWRAILPLFTGLQKALIPQAGQMLSLGVPDRHLESLPAQFERLVADKPAMLIGQPGGLTAGEYLQLKASGKAFERMCLELASLGIPATLHHDDFHDGNVFIQGEQVCFTDWGESALAHPFFTLVVLLRGAENSLGLESDAPELSQMRDWYLAQWTEYASPADLQTAAGLALQVGMLNRALTWHAVLRHGLPENLRPEYAHAVPAYMQELVISLNKN